MNVINYIRNVILEESYAVKELSSQIDESFENAIKLLGSCNGKVIVTGVGKSGHVGKKIAASLASMGTPAFFIHSTEGLHGDLGMIQANDVVIMISNSGETAEVLSLIPSIKKIGATTIAITSKSQSTLAKASNVCLAFTYQSEVDHLQLAPTTSSTIMLVIGDALAASLSYSKGFTKEDFHKFHPGGSLGKQLSEN